MKIQTHSVQHTVNGLAGGFLMLSLAISGSLLAQPVSTSGKWRSLDINGKFSFVSYVAASPNSIAIAGLDGKIKPSVWKCKPLSLSRCTKLSRGLEKELTAASAIQFNAAGDLFAMFTLPVHALENPAHTEVKKLPLGHTKWQAFENYAGASLSLDVTGGNLLVGSTYALSTLGSQVQQNFRAAVDYYDGNGNVLAQGLNYDSDAFTAMASDGMGQLYAAGPDHIPKTALRSAYASVWQWTPSKPVLERWSKIAVPTRMTSITAMVGDGSGSIYIAGSDELNHARVFKYENGNITDTGLGAFLVSSLAYSANGYLVAAGQDASTYQGQTWVYNATNATWQSLNLTGATQIVNVAINSANNRIYLVGSDRRGRSRIWTYQ